MTPLRAWVLCVAVLAGVAAPAAAADPFEFKDGDRVVLLGSTLIEREQYSGDWELMLTLGNKDKAVTFRNLGWSGDTVFGEARNGFDQFPKGFERLVALTKELKPTVVIVCYGHNESFEGPAGVDRFTKGLEKLLDELAATKARLVLLTPTPFVPSMRHGTRTVPDADTVARNNRNLDLYVTAIRETAKRRRLDVVDLHTRAKTMDAAGLLGTATDNGMHWLPIGYHLLSFYLWTEYPPGVKGVEWRQILGPPQADELRAAIVAKNRLFFHRWRPQNETYLFGFRKHEQGKNAREVAEFDPLVAKAEQEIRELRKAIK